MKDVVTCQNSKIAVFLSPVEESCLSTHLFFLILPAYSVHDISGGTLVHFYCRDLKRQLKLH